MAHSESNKESTGNHRRNSRRSSAGLLGKLISLFRRNRHASEDPPPAILVDTEGHEQILEEDESQMVRSIIALDETMAREIMVPRIDVVALDVNTSLSDVVRTTLQRDGRPVLSTADNGRGDSDDRLTGAVESQKFLVTGPLLRFTMYGSVDERVYIELTDPVSGMPYWSARQLSDDPVDVTWELFELVGQEVVFRLVDESKVGSIAIGNLRIEDGAAR